MKKKPPAPMRWAVSPIPWKPHLGQLKGVKFLLEHAGGGLFADPGVGKSSITLASFSYLKKRGVANKMLIIAPLKPCWLVWPAEVKKWIDFNHLKIVVLHGPKKQEALESDADIYVINPEGLDWLLDAKKMTSASGRPTVTVDLKRFKALGFDTLCVDEISKFKHSNTTRFKTLKCVLGTFARRWGLTGSPASNGLMDLFGQCYVLDQGRSLGSFITHYRNRYFHQGWDGFSWVLNAGAEEQIYERLRPLVLRLAAEDYIDMPELVSTAIEFDLPPDARAFYDSLEENLVAGAGEEVFTAANAGAAVMKCRQVCNGGIYTNPEILGLMDTKTASRARGREWFPIHDEKTDLLSDLVDELQGQPLFVAYDFGHDLERLYKKFGKDIPTFGGGISTKKTIEIEAAWNAGEIPLLFGQPKSIAHGVNLQQKGHHVCWYGVTYNYEDYDQFNRRVWRQGNNASRVFVYHLVARGTVDMDVMAALNRKESGQNALFKGIRERRGLR